MTTVRSVTARLNADVGGYITDMRRAGRETEQAFRSMSRSVGDANQALGVNDTTTQKATASSRQLGNATGNLNTQLGRLPASLGKSADATRKYGNEMGRLPASMKSVETAETNLRRALTQVEDSTGRLRVAEMKLAEVRANGKATASQTAAAEESVARARRNLTAVTAKAESATLTLASANDNIGSSTRQSGAEIDRLSGRLRLLADAVAVLGPGLVPIGALAVPAIAGLANQLGIAALAGGTAMLAFQGVGDTVKAMNEAAVEPTTENLLKVEAELAKLSPQAAEFARGIGDMRDVFIETRDAAAGGLFSELNQGLPDLEGVLGRVQPLLESVGAATGDMLADGLASLNSERWQPFFDFLEAQAGPTLQSLGSTVGDFAHGLSELWMAFQPLNNDFTGWLEGVGDGFDGWASGISQTDGFREFMAYVRDTGPQVGDTFAAIGGAMLDIAEAAAPFGGPVLAGLEAFANVVGAIADSPVGPLLVGMAGGLALVNRAMAVQSRLAAAPVFASMATNLDKVKGAATGASGGLSAFAANARSSVGQAARIAGPLAGLALASSDLGDKAGATAASMTLFGAAFGPYGAVAGAAVGTVMELAQANDEVASAVDRANAAAKDGTLQQAQEEYVSIVDKMASVESTGSFWEETIGGGMLERGMSKLTGETREAEEATMNLQDRLGRSRGVIGGLGDLFGQPFDGAALAAEGAAMSVQTFMDVSTRLGNILTSESGLVNYRQSYDDLAASLKENGDNFNTLTQAGRDNTNMVLGSTAAALEFARTLKGERRVDFLQNFRKDLNGLLGDIPGADRLLGKVNRQLNRFGAVDIRKKIKIEGAEDAAGQVQRLGRRFDALPKRLRTRIENQGIPESIGEVQALKKRYDLTPREVRTLMELQAAGAIQGIGNVRQLLQRVGGMKPRPEIAAQDSSSGVINGIIGLISRVQSKSVTITTTQRTILQTVRLGGGKTLAASGFAEGGFNFPTQTESVRVYAEGGTDRDPTDRANWHTPEISRSGSTRVWREPETGGEAFIPLRNDARRVRAKQIMEETAGIFGGEVSWNARGSRSGGSYQRQSGGGGSDFPSELLLRGRMQTQLGWMDIEAVADVAASRQLAEYAGRTARGSRIRNSRERDQ